MVGELLPALSLEEGAHVCQGGLHPDDPEDDLPLLQGNGAVLLALCWGEMGGEGDVCLEDGVGECVGVFSRLGHELVDVVQGACLGEGGHVLGDRCHPQGVVLGIRVHGCSEGGLGPVIGVGLAGPVGGDAFPFQIQGQASPDEFQGGDHLGSLGGLAHLLPGKGVCFRLPLQLDLEVGLVPGWKREGKCQVKLSEGGMGKMEPACLSLGASRGKGGSSLPRT